MTKINKKAKVEAEAEEEQEQARKKIKLGVANFIQHSYGHALRPCAHGRHAYSACARTHYDTLARGMPCNDP